MLDNAALAPLASVVITDTSSCTVRAGFLVVAVAGVLAAFVVSMLPKFTGMRRVMKYQIGRWLTEHTQSRRSRSPPCCSSPSRGPFAAPQSSCS